MATLKSVAWNLVLALLCIPAAVVSVVMLPWIPLVASLMAAITRGGARWLGVKIRYRTPHRWFDWQQFYHLTDSAFALDFEHGVVAVRGGYDGGILHRSFLHG